MKSKEQKRREAIERLERAPRWCSRFPEPSDWAQTVWSRRLEEAARLRRKFGLAS
jgi:hypothetical protein